MVKANFGQVVSFLFSIANDCLVVDVRGIEIPDFTPEDDTMEEDNLGEEDGSDE